MSTSWTLDFGKIVLDVKNLSQTYKRILDTINSRGITTLVARAEHVVREFSRLTQSTI